MAPPWGTDVNIVIVGAGVLRALHAAYATCRGLRAVVIEAADGVGGARCLYRYPGARCDFENYGYCVSFSEET